jgi:hypothetical protein
MKEKWTPHIIAVAAFVVFIVLGLACASEPPPKRSAPEVYTKVPYSELKERIEQVKSPGQGFLVEAYIAEWRDRVSSNIGSIEGGFRILSSLPDGESLDLPVRHWLTIRQIQGFYTEDFNQFEKYNDQTFTKRIDRDKLYRIYIGVYQFYDPSDSHNHGKLVAFIDRIEGLITLEEIAAIEAQQRAEREAAEKEANRYDSAKFIIVPSYFQPASYTKADLFEAVATSEKLGISGLSPSGIDWGAPSRNFVSDVVFVSQNGTDITFRTADNAISKNMKVGSRTGLTSGQRVRIYYTVYRIKDWTIDAIERM